MSSMLPQAPRFMLRLDAITVRRSSGTAVDSEGDPTGGRVVVLQGRATLASIRAVEGLWAAQRGSTVDKALDMELGMDVIEGDWVDVQGATYEVVSAEDRRLHRRCLMRKI